MLSENSEKSLLGESLARGQFVLANTLLPITESKMKNRNLLKIISDDIIIYVDLKCSLHSIKSSIEQKIFLIRIVFPRDADNSPFPMSPWSNIE